MATPPKSWPDSAMSAYKGVTGTISQTSHRETCPGRVAPCVPMGCLTTPMEFLRPTGKSGTDTHAASAKYAVNDENNPH